jgi:phosphoribosylformylglycinamidine synthase
VDLALEARVQAFLRQAISNNLVASAHDLSDGGLAEAAAEGCLAAGLGAELDLPAGGERLDRLLFAEGGGRILVSVPSHQSDAWQEALAQAGAGGAALPAQRLGQVVADAELRINLAGSSLLRLPIAAMAASYEQAIPRRLGADLPPAA